MAGTHQGHDWMLIGLAARMQIAGHMDAIGCIAWYDVIGQVAWEDRVASFERFQSYSISWR